MSLKKIVCKFLMGNKSKQTINILQLLKRLFAPAGFGKNVISCGETKCQHLCV